MTTKNFWCLMEEKILLKGPCLYEKGGALKGNKTCPGCSYYQDILLPAETKRSQFEGPVRFTLKTFINHIGQKEWERIKSKDTQIPNYKIDPRLKVGKHYPVDLAVLCGIFNELPSLKICLKGDQTRTRDFKELTLLERTFKEYFLQHSIEQKRKCVRKINKRLQRLHPLLIDGKDTIGDWSYFLNPFLPEDSNNGIILFWASLAKVISDNQIIKLIHQCPACKKIFFSKQSKKYHSECRGPYLSKVFSERYVKSGKAAEKQKRYRKNLKRKQLK